MNEATTLRMERTFNAPAQAVFDAWTRRRSTCAWAAGCEW